MSDQDRYMEIVEAAFDDYIVEFELDTEGSIDDLFFEIFSAGFDSAMEMMDDEEDE